MVGIFRGGGQVLPVLIWGLSCRLQRIGQSRAQTKTPARWRRGFSVTQSHDQSKCQLPSRWRQAVPVRTISRPRR
jgi:hypothetical protein